MSRDALASSSLAFDSGTVSRISFSVLTQTHVSDTCTGLPVLGSPCQSHSIFLTPEGCAPASVASRGLEGRVVGVD